jgi:HK97 family phage major capsid protein
MEIINFSADLEASESRRIIAGKIAPYGDEIGNTSAGRVIFEANSIQIDDPKKIKLLLEHDPKKPLGFMKTLTEDSSGLFAEFKVSNTTRGTDSLIEASENLRSGLSVGVEVIKGKNKDGVYRVSAARLLEVSLVQAAAFKSAEVTSVAASENTEAVSTENKTEKEEIVENTNTETPVATEVVETPAVEASRPTVQAAIYTKPRIAPMTSGQYLEASIKAAMGDESARQTILATDDTTTNTGLTLAPHLTEFITNTLDVRPSVDAVSRGALPTSGMSFTIPKLTTAPTIDSNSTEGEALGGTEMASGYITVDVKKAAGLQTISWELLDRSSPIFYDELIRELNRAYAKATDEAMFTQFITTGTAGTAVATADADGLQSFIATEAAAAYAATGGFATNLVSNSSWWSVLLGAQDSTKRPIYAAANPVNNAGIASPSAVVGSVLGTNYYVDPYIGSGTGDDSMFLVNPSSITFYEAPKTTLRVEALSNGRLQVAVYGYYAIATKLAGGIRRWNKS